MLWFVLLLNINQNSQWWPEHGSGFQLNKLRWRGGGGECHWLGFKVKWCIKFLSSAENLQPRVEKKRGSFLLQNNTAFTNRSCNTATQAEKVNKTTLATMTLFSHKMEKHKNGGVSVSMGIRASFQK